MPDYDVSWDITIEADGPQGAAHTAWRWIEEAHHDAEVQCTVLVVTDRTTGQQWTVNMAEETEDQAIEHHA